MWHTWPSYVTPKSWKTNVHIMNSSCSFSLCMRRASCELCKTYGLSRTMLKNPHLCKPQKLKIHRHYFPSESGPTLQLAKMLKDLSSIVPSSINKEGVKNKVKSTILMEVLGTSTWYRHLSSHLARKQYYGQVYNTILSP